MTALASKVPKALIEKNTPSKNKASLPSHMSSPGFDFSFTRPESDLSAEAQKIMDSVREEAARIKAQMDSERGKQEDKDRETNQLYGVGGRKIAQPKGKSGRFSDVHKQQFKKMDSIANHASTWKNKIQANATSLKRSNSKAGLDEPEPRKQLSKTTSSRSLRSIADSGRLENNAPGKRAKKSYQDDTSAGRPNSRENDHSMETAPSTPAKATALPSAVRTPTKASLARSVSIKSMKTSMIPSLSRSASSKTLNAPKSEGSNKYLSSLSKFGNMKSILHRHQPKFSDDPAKIAAGTHLPAPKGTVNLDKELPTLPGAFPSSEQHPPTVKRVEFTPNTKSLQESMLTPSPSKSKIPTQIFNKPAASEPSTPSEAAIEYPALLTSPNITHRPSSKGRDAIQPSTPGDFTFTSSRTLTFGPSTTGLTPGSTIRPVRPSGFPTPVPESLGQGDMPAIAHGIKNKKRKHAADSDDDDEQENKPPASTDGEEEGERGAKRAKTAPAVSAQASPQKGSRIPKFGGRIKPMGKLTKGRLNMLARPKERR